MDKLEAAKLEARERVPTPPLPEMVGESHGMLELARLIRLVAPRSSTVLIEGETGTGKELVAQAVHQLSARASKPFVVLNCAAIPESLLEAELFGHTRGAFTGAVQSRTGRIESADGGTLFLDEIGEMPLALQAKILRFLESGELQRVGNNEVVQRGSAGDRGNPRAVAATRRRACLPPGPVSPAGRFSGIGASAARAHGGRAAAGGAICWASWARRCR